MNATRDIYEVANQLEGYVGPDTPELLANFLMREGQFASDLADEIVRLRACISPQSPSGPADIITRLMPIADDARKAGLSVARASISVWSTPYRSRQPLARFSESFRGVLGRPNSRTWSTVSAGVRTWNRRPGYRPSAIARSLCPIDTPIW